MPAGRPRKSERGAKLVRLPAEVVEMIGWIARVEGVTAADILMPMIHAMVEARYQKWSPEIARLQRAEDEVAKAASRK